MYELHIYSYAKAAVEAYPSLNLGSARAILSDVFSGIPVNNCGKIRLQKYQNSVRYRFNTVDDVEGLRHDVVLTIKVKNKEKTEPEKPAAPNAPWPYNTHFSSPMRDEKELQCAVEEVVNTSPNAIHQMGHDYVRRALNLTDPKALSANRIISMLEMEIEHDADKTKITRTKLQVTYLVHSSVEVSLRFDTVNHTPDEE